ncbi:hypothetical protein NDU88_003337 [Pleurodeles waltl]|uniref:Uncharacterized protein n=1 Tax=Pleurodeles waltl TaxID=8319 RepID=A0AAV7WR67_PLEWA|nr:hypothetical protein NDU88_003337 [Pleurodeles waltl]
MLPLGGRGLAAEENGRLRGKLCAPGWFRASAGELFFITNLLYALSVQRMKRARGAAGIRGSEQPLQQRQASDRAWPTTMR